MKAKIVIALMAFLILGIGSGRPAFSGELPYGAMLDDNYANGLTQDGLDSLKNLLGFNLLYVTSLEGNVSLSRQSDLAGDGFEIISYMTDPDDDSLTLAFQRYLNAHYLLTQAENTDLQIRFLVRNGHIGQDPNWYVAPKSDTSFYFLDDLGYTHEVGFGWQVNFEPFLRMRLWREQGVQDADTVATMVIWQSDNKSWEGYDHRHNSIFKTYVITADSLPGDTARTLVLDPFTLSGVTLSGIYLTYQINALHIGSISSSCSLAVDWLKVYNQEGHDIVEDTVYNARFRNHILSNPPATFFQLRDDMHTDMMMPARRLDSLITTYSDKGSMMKYYEGFISSPTDMLKIARPKRFWIDRYPLYGGGKWDTCATGGPTTYYSGYENDPDNGLYGLQYRIDEEITSRVAGLKAACGDSVDLWYIPQAQSAQPASCELYWNRPPTASELSMQVWMALCYGVAGIHFWPYASYQTPWHHYTGLVYENGSPTPSWICLKDRVTPYLKAIDTVYTGLIWQRAYAYHEGTPSRTPPAGAFISSISAISNTSDPNPDEGWFHVGEYTKTGTYDKYVMLLNRACSQGEWNSAEAPSITATVKFNSNLGNDSSFYIIDLATGTDSADWVGTPETTYTAIMSDGTIPYTIRLKAGEGKLLRIVATNRMSWSGNINTGYIYQGKIDVAADASIPASQTLQILGPARVEVRRCNDVKLNIYGQLVAKGTSLDSILFVSDTTYQCIPASTHPQPGDWYGIVDHSGMADTLLYCAIRYASDAFRGEGHSNALLRHCGISLCNGSGVHILSAGSETTTIDFSSISCGTYGINADASMLILGDNYLAGNPKGAIYICRHPQSLPNSQQFISGNEITGIEGSNPLFGIQLLGNASDQYRPTAVLVGNQVKHASQAGVYLYRTRTGNWLDSTGVLLSGGNVIDSNGIYGIWLNQSSPAIFAETGFCVDANFIERNGIYGIYCTNSSSPKIQETAIKNNGSANVNCATYSQPNLGDGTTVLGDNAFETTLYDIKNNLIPIQVIQARGNYWGEWLPDSTDFYPSAAWTDFGDSTMEKDCGGTLAPKLAEVSIPLSFALGQNYPNPFNPTTSIFFDLPEASWVRLSVYNLLGQKIRTIAERDFPAGSHSLIWNGRNDSGSEVASGVYFYLLEAGDFKDVKKMLMLR